MKHLKALLLLLVVTTCSYAQNTKGKTDDMGRISLNTYVPDQIEGLPPAARNSLESKLTQIASSNGMGGNSYNPRFIITANVVVLTKDITPTVPPMFSYSLEVTLFVGDGLEGRKMASISTTVKGVDTNETKAYISALRNLNPNDQKMKAFVEEGKSKIIGYYNSNCDFIIKGSKALAAQKKFDEAIYKLTGVPEVCLDCFNQSMDAIEPIYKQKIDFECKAKMTEANSIWNANQNYESAQKVGAILSSIDPDASCYEDIKALGEKISQRIQDVDKREWSLTMENELTKRQLIDAYKEIGMAYGNGQPKEITYNVNGWW